MNKEMNIKAHEAAFGGGSASDTPKAALRAPMAPPLSFLIKPFLNLDIKQTV